MEAPSHVTLTSHERYLVCSVVCGRTNREMASDLGVTDQAIKTELSKLYEKCHVQNRLDLLLFAVCHGLVSG